MPHETHGWLPRASEQLVDEQVDALVVTTEELGLELRRANIEVSTLGARANSFVLQPPSHPPPAAQQELMARGVGPRAS